MTYRFGQLHISASVENNPANLSGDEINKAISRKVTFIPGTVGILPKEAYVTPALRAAMSTETRYSEMYRSSLLHLKEQKKYLDKINTILSKYLDVSIDEVNFDPNQDLHINIKYSQKNILLDLSNSGSGMLQIIQVLVYIYLYEPNILLIDEPDAHLHPSLQSSLGDILKEISKEMNAQLFLATHSSQIIDSFDPKYVYFISSEKEIIKSIGDSNLCVDQLVADGLIVNSTISTIAAFRQPFVIVEDKHINILKKICELNKLEIFSSPSRYTKAEGVSKFTTIHGFYKILEQISGTSVKAIFIQDSDGLPDKYIGYIQKIYQDIGLNANILKRHEIENYILDSLILQKAIKCLGKEKSIQDIDTIIKQAADSIRTMVRVDIRDKAKQINRLCEKPDGMKDKQVESDVDQWFEEQDLSNVSRILEIFPGKELFREIRSILSEEQIDLRENMLLNILSPELVDDELLKILKSANSNFK